MLHIKIYFLGHFSVFQLLGSRIVFLKWPNYFHSIDFPLFHISPIYRVVKCPRAQPDKIFPSVNWWNLKKGEQYIAQCHKSYTFYCHCMSETGHFTTLWTLEHFTTLEIGKMYCRLVNVHFFWRFNPFRICKMFSLLLLTIHNFCGSVLNRSNSSRQTNKL